jgi:hypothetical protein
VPLKPTIDQHLDLEFAIRVEMRRRNFVFAGVASVSLAAAFGVRSQQSGRNHRLAWLDIDLPQATEVFSNFEKLLNAWADRHGLSLEIKAFSWGRQNGTLPIEHAVSQSIEWAPTLFVCLSHHSALEVRRVLEDAPIMLVSVLDPLDVGLVLSGLAGISYDKVASMRALDLLSHFPAVADSTVAVVAASEWQTPRRMNALAATAAASRQSYRVLSAESFDELAASSDWQSRRSFAAWWIPESILLFDNRQRLVDEISRLRAPHVFGRRSSVEMGAMLGLQPYSVDWQRWLYELLAEFLRGHPLDALGVHEIDAWHCFANAATIRSFGAQVPAAVVTSIDAFV